MLSPKSRVFALLLCCLSLPAWAQSTTIPQEYDKLITQHSVVAAFGVEGFGDRIDLNSGGLEIIQTDVDLPGNGALPVRVARLYKLSNYPTLGRR